MITPVRIKTKEGVILPKYETEGAACLDVRAFIPDDIRITLKPLQRAAIPTGIFLEVPERHVVNVVPRSGLAYKHGVTVLNAPGKIDSDYRGELMIILVNLSDQPFDVRHNERIAQLELGWVELVRWVPVKELTETKRGAGGLGSTNMK